ncbi:MAG: hypothetical protein AAFN76_02600 [Pseudomonadota bacterium]
MNLRDDQTPLARQCSDEVWDMIPWYVNGSLPEAEVQQFEREAASCEVCQAEIERQRFLADQVAVEKPVEQARVRSWEIIRAQLDTETVARAPRSEPRRWFAGRNAGALGLTGLTAAVCLFVVVQFGGPGEDGFVTLTTAAEQAEAVIKFQPVPGLKDDRLNAIIAEHGLTNLSGPTDAGIYTVNVPKDGDAMAIADLLMALPEVDFAAPEGP